jgi:hypothetical protein
MSIVPKLSRLALPALAAHLLAVAPGAAAQRSPTPALDPRTDVSASGAYALRVEPGSPAGRGGASYRLDRNGATAWSAELPFTLWESVVADDGTVAGYAYGHGLDGWSGVRGDHSQGDFRVVILDPEGALRLDVATERVMSRFLHSLPTPVAAGLILDPDNDRVTIRVEDADLNRGTEEWWPFSLSTGKELQTFRPRELMADPEPASFILRARPVQQTPLSLLQWWTFAYGSDYRHFIGTRFTLVDLEGVPVWTLDLPADYTLPDDKEGEKHLRNEMSDHGAVLGCDEPGRFEIGLVGDGHRVIFEVTQDAAAKTGWKVVEVARAEWSREAPAVAPAVMREGRLEQVGSIELGGAPAPQASLGWIMHFDVDDRGRFGLVREGDDHARAFLLLSPEGALLAEVPLQLDVPGEAARLQASWIARDRWLLFLAWPGSGNDNPAWWLDAGSGRTEPIAGLRLPAVMSLDADGVGGFVALVNTSREYSSEETIVAVDAAGRTRWTMETGSEDETLPLAPEAVAVAGDGRIGVLDNIRKVLLVYAADGRHAATIDLAQSWGREPTYPTDLVAEARGGWIAGDFQSEVPLVRMSSEGRVTGELRPAFPDGRRLDPMLHLVAALDGGLWTTDAHALLHVNGEGLVDRVVGSAPDPDRIDAIAAIVVDPMGRLLVGDERTGAVHVFDAEGRRLFVCRPEPQDEQGCRQIAGAPDGRIFAGGEKGLLCFSPSGERTGTTSSLSGSFGEQWLFQPKGGTRWVVSYEGVSIVSADGRVVRRIDKRPDGTWLTAPREGSMAPDGSLAVISGSVCTYAPDGEPRECIALPEGADYAALAFDGERLVLAAQDALFVRRIAPAGAWKRYPFARPTHGFSAVLPAPDGRRVRLVPFRSAQVLEYRLLD